jgi:PEP-CTERM motif
MEYCDLSRATVTMEVAGLTSDLHDQIICGDEMDFALSIIRVAFDDAYAPDRGDAWALFVPAVDCAIPASLAEAIFALPENCHLDPATGVMTYAPEPSTWALTLLGLTALKAKRRHRRL